MKIAFVSTNLITCGGIKTVFEYVSRLKKQGVDADIYAEEGNQDLEKYYGITYKPIHHLEMLEESDVIVAVRWEQVQLLNNFKPKNKIQFVQANDIDMLGNQDGLREARNDAAWSLMGVSSYALLPWGRGVVIPNGVNEEFLQKYPSPQRDIDVLIEGNDESNKNIPEALALARKIEPNGKIVWLGRETHQERGVFCITNPPQEEIPLIYRRSKIFIKLSKSEGFCLPILEAMASGCLVITRDMGGNDFCNPGINCLFNYEKELFSNNDDLKKTIIDNAMETARLFSWDYSLRLFRLMAKV